MLKSKLFLATALALVAMAAVVANAGASTISRVEAGGPITSPSSGKLTFGEGSTTIQCEITLRGSLARGPIEATAGRTFGSITEVSINRASCTGGEVESVLGLPWALTYTEANPSQASLPNNVTGLRFTLNRAAFLLSTFFGIVNCLYSGNAGAILSLSATRTAGVYNTPTSPLPLRADESVRLPKNTERSSGACPATGTMRGTFGLSAVQTITVV